ncbi:MAG: hypothetical protein GY778_26475 [bacterium]|nr:hypothetical protein [bacterium]
MRSSQVRVLQVAAVLLTPTSAVWAADVTPHGDNFTITANATIAAGSYSIADADGNGAIHISGDDITVDFQGAEIVGSGPDQAPDSFAGTGLVITGSGITVKNVKVRGYKVGILARDAPGLVIEDADLSDNYRRRLKSTPQREALSDWISPHRNDDGQWRRFYGAALYVERSDRVTVRRIRVRNGQNGIILDRVNDAKIYDNDCSFLSGWGLALWRSSRNAISRNALDFCVRGYSHGVYNRGQDSAGILLFEQNNDNVIAENSATHGGDGLFGYGGRESMAGSGRTGNNGNLIIGNDFSYAAAHGLEMTFSFDNRILKNRLTGNAVCGIWGGYSQDMLIAGNTIENNGQAGYGSERGGINIEHGRGNVINHNVFRGNACGVYLWSDADTRLMREPWVKANHQGSIENTIGHNVFSGDPVGVQLRRTIKTRLISNTMKEVERPVDADEESKPEINNALAVAWKAPDDYPVHGQTRPVGARAALAGREKIVLTEWGPYDFVGSAVVPERVAAGAEADLRVLAPGGEFKVTGVDGQVTVSPMTGTLPAILKVATDDDGVQAFRVDVDAAGQPLSASGHLFKADWTVRFFAWNPGTDPRKHAESWKRRTSGPWLDELQVRTLDFDWALGGPTRQVPPDQFGTVATTTVSLPEGLWTLRAVSDDGIRVWIDDQLVIEDWTWHPAKEDRVTVPLQAGVHTIRIEHFEIDGYARLALLMEPAADGSE